ncbi:hypothetical protein AQUCO_05700159v1 [Aquilegia coerulea]|uniref:non-specific serine/threonine protein kinase n=1 Tax=Aquilegia coerulea TaxID=218851 RepID=A0A2G5CG53_AQUCA|nr:hypothetical protein AQUCO_05700159v1 [Aquilegia coerulea]
MLKGIASVKSEDDKQDGGNAVSKSVDMLLSELAREKPQPFSHEELKRFTQSFNVKIGSGGFGDIFKGHFPNGVPIAVKVLKTSDADVMGKQFRNELSTMGRITHRSLIKLYGYCYNADITALVYEYMENGSFDKILFKNHLNIPWRKLFDIAIEIAKGISYLHESQIIHHDIKPSNVLLDSNLSPKVIDYGLASVNVELSQFAQTGFIGTRGYAAPEVSMGVMGPQGKISSKCDVFSFGIMLFDILGSKRNGESQDWLPGQVLKILEEKRLDEFIRKCGIEEKDEEEANILSRTALLCTQYNPPDRPSMSTVVKMLEGEIQLWTPVSPYPYYDPTSESSSRGGSTRSRHRGPPKIVSSTTYNER